MLQALQRKSSGIALLRSTTKIRIVSKLEARLCAFRAAKENCRPFGRQVLSINTLQCPQCGFGSGSGRGIRGARDIRKDERPSCQAVSAIYAAYTDKMGHSALRLSKDIRASYQTLWLAAHKIREAMASWDEPKMAACRIIQCKSFHQRRFCSFVDKHLQRYFNEFRYRYN
jgi:ribosomal protein L37E